LFGLVGDFRGVPGQHALIEVFDRSKRRRIAEDDIEKSQPLHVPPEHDKTDRERGRQYKTDSAPIHYQNVAEITTATGEIPVLWP
jgi:hypothetical protein